MSSLVSIVVCLLVMVGLTGGLGDFKVVNSHENGGAEVSLKLCVGITPLGQDWEENTLPTYKLWSKFGHKFISTIVDISDCNFVNTPIVTTTLDFNSEGLTNSADFTKAALISGTTNIAGANKDKFEVHLNGFEEETPRNSLTSSFGKERLSIHWHAIGYTLQS